jgi:hypothetical protein
MSRLVASVLAIGFANHETAECTPGIAALMKAVAASRSTVQRALADLQAVGWIECLGGSAPGIVASYRFRMPERVSPVTPERVSHVTPERVSPVTPTCVMQDAPPIPPYKDKPNMNQKARGKTAGLTPRQLLRGMARPAPHLSALVVFGSHNEAGWEAWLAKRGYPALDKIGRRIGTGMLKGWDMPWASPPQPDAFCDNAIADRFVKWLRN